MRVKAQNGDLMWEREKQRKYLNSVAEKERKSERERKSISRKESDYAKMSERREI